MGCIASRPACAPIAAVADEQPGTTQLPLRRAGQIFRWEGASASVNTDRPSGWSAGVSLAIPLQLVVARSRRVKVPMGWRNPSKRIRGYTDALATHKQPIASLGRFSGIR